MKPGARGRGRGESGGPRGTEGFQKCAAASVSWGSVFKLVSTCSKQPPPCPIGGHAEGSANGDKPLAQRHLSEARGPPSSACHPVRGEGRDMWEEVFLPRKGHVGTRVAGPAGRGIRMLSLAAKRSACPGLVPNSKFGPSAS